MNAAGFVARNAALPSPGTDLTRLGVASANYFKPGVFLHVILFG